MFSCHGGLRGLRLLLFCAKVETIATLAPWDAFRGGAWWSTTWTLKAPPFLPAPGAVAGVSAPKRFQWPIGASIRRRRRTWPQRGAKNSSHGHNCLSSSVFLATSAPLCGYTNYLSLRKVAPARQHLLYRNNCDYTYVCPWNGRGQTREIEDLRCV